MERLFQILAVILAGIAAFSYWRGDTENAFITGVFAAVCFFLVIRFQAKKRMEQREAEWAAAEEEEEWEEEDEEEGEKGRWGDGDIEDIETPLLNDMAAKEQIDRELRARNNEPLATNNEQKTTDNGRRTTDD